jgi:KRAB domain-containing zinc finger protein
MSDQRFTILYSFSEERIYYCSICAKGFAREAVKKRHEKIHQQVKANEELKNNVDEVAKPKPIKYTKPVPAAPKTFVCEVCGDTTQDRKLHNKHIQIHEELQVTCSYCDLKFPTKNHYEHHVKRQHTMILKCNVCDKIFGSKKPFERHMMIHSGVRPYVCETCGASYITKGALKTHNQTAHLKCFKERPRSFLCEPCGKGFISKSVLYTHIDSVHMGARNYKCAICNQSYKTKSQLNEHERRHAKDSIPCPMCSLVFNCKANLKKHMRRKKMSCPSYVPTKKPRAETV